MKLTSTILFYLFFFTLLSAQNDSLPKTRIGYLLHAGPMFFANKSFNNLGNALSQAQNVNTPNPYNAFVIQGASIIIKEGNVESEFYFARFRANNDLASNQKLVFLIDGVALKSLWRFGIMNKKRLMATFYGGIGYMNINFDVIDRTIRNASFSTLLAQSSASH